MTEPYLAEIRMFAGNFAPSGWAFCNGQLLPIDQNQAIFALIGTFYGGNGTTTFALPDFQGRVPIHMGQGAGLSSYDVGQAGGGETVTLSTAQIPSHNHGVAVNPSNGTRSSPVGNVPATTLGEDYTTATTELRMNADMITKTGSGEPHPNIQPYLAVSFIIALEGIFPSRN
jgi:microcystin-dependent protein